ncbi:hypothetical protein Hdeb2414_s0016g00483131 [Helianthus debilis subsp. tardiflorus]
MMSFSYRECAINVELRGVEINDGEKTIPYELPWSFRPLAVSVYHCCQLFRRGFARDLQKRRRLRQLLKK